MRGAWMLGMNEIKPSCWFVIAIMMLGAMRLVCAEPLDMAKIGSNDIENVRRAFEAVNARFDRLVSFQYKVERKTIARGVTVVEKWSFVCASNNLIRIDYTAPEKRIFLFAGGTFTEYLPAARKALRTPLADGGTEAQTRVTSVIKRVSVDGLRLGDYEKLLAHLSSVEQPTNHSAIMIVKGHDPLYAIRLDTQRHVLLSFEKWDLKGRLELSIQAKDFTEPAPGFWIPSYVKTVFLDENGKGEMESTLSGIRINGTLPKETFDFTLPADVKILSSKDN